MTASLVAALERAAPSDDAGDLAGMLELLEPDLAAVLPADWPPRRFGRELERELERTPSLYDAPAGELITAGLLAVAHGLELGAAGHLYLVPAGGRLYFELGELGLLELAGYSPTLRSLEARTVYAGDSFDFQHGSRPALKHRPAFDDAAGEPIAYYAVAQLRAGGATFEVLTAAEAAAAREASPIGLAGESAWTLDYTGAAHKTAAARLVRRLPGMREVAAVLERDSQPVPAPAELVGELAGYLAEGGSDAHS